MRSILLIAIFFCFCLSANAQKETWKKFEKSRFNDKYVEEYDSYASLIVYDDNLKSLDGKEITITGYFIPVEEQIVIISRRPNSSCFFCGQAGMESVMEVRSKKSGKIKFKTDDLLTYKGILKVNHSDWQHVSLILEEAELLKVE